MPNRTATLSHPEASRPKSAQRDRENLAQTRAAELYEESVIGASRRADFLDAAIRSQAAILKAMVAEREHIVERWIPELQRLEVERVRLQEDRVKEPRRRERLGAVS